MPVGPSSGPAGPAMLAPHMKPTHPTGRSRIRFFRVAGIAIFVIALAGVSVVCAAILLTRPDRTPIGAAPSDLDARAVAFDSEDGTRLRGWYIDGWRGCGAMLLLHGVHADRRQMLGRARVLIAAGYSVLLADSRAHGESDGDAITFGYLESADAKAALEYLREQAPGEPVGIVGVSLGGAAALLAAPPLRVDALVVEQVYSTVDEALENRLRLYLGLPGALLAPPLRIATRWWLGIDAGALRPVDHIAHIDAPVFVIAGESDRHTTIAQSRALFEAAAEPKRFWSVPGAAHVDLQRLLGPAYAEQVLTFLAESMRPDANAVACSMRSAQ